MAAKKKSNRKITSADLAAAAKLKSVWDSRKRAKESAGEPFRQEDFLQQFGEALGRAAPVSQGLVSQYLNGHTVLNYKALMAFCRFLEYPPTEIRNDLPEQQAESRDPLKNLSGDVKALRYLMSAVVGLIGGKSKSDAQELHDRLMDLTEDDEAFREYGYLGGLLAPLAKAGRKAGASRGGARRREAS